MENGKFYKNGVNVLKLVEEEKDFNKECVNLLWEKVNHVREKQSSENHAMNSLVFQYLGSKKLEN